jgi:hypothetical protein
MSLSSVSGFVFSPEAWRRRIRQRKRPVQGRSQATVEALLAAKRENLALTLSLREPRSSLRTPSRA